MAALRVEPGEMRPRLAQPPPPPLQHLGREGADGPLAGGLSRLGAGPVPRLDPKREIEHQASGLRSGQDLHRPPPRVLAFAPHLIQQGLLRLVAPIGRPARHRPLQDVEVPHLAERLGQELEASLQRLELGIGDQRLEQAEGGAQPP